MVQNVPGTYRGEGKGGQGERERETEVGKSPWTKAQSCIGHMVCTFFK